MKTVNRIAKVLACVAGAICLLLVPLGKLNSQQTSEPLEPVSSKLADGRLTLEGSCDLKNYIISKNNGAQHTIKFPKNTGTCSLSVFSLDGAGRLIAGSAQTISPGNQIESYTSAANAQWTAFSCTFGKEICKIEVQ